MQAESSQPPRTALAASGVVPTRSTSPYLAAAPPGLFASPPVAQSPLFDPASQGQQQQQQQQQHNQHIHHQPQPPPPLQHPDLIAANGAFQHPAARGFHSIVHDPSGPSNEAAFRVPDVPRTAPVIDFGNPYQQQLDSHIHLQQQHHYPHPVPYHPSLYASTSYSSLAGSSPVPDFPSGFPSHGAYTHSDLGTMPPNPMMRYNSFAMSGDGSSSGTPGPMTQQDIDNLLAMSRAQAGNHGDASAFPCTYCDKVYTGKHARSIWRRHLQDKHNIPLSAQPRRTRWDGDVNRPKNAEERRARMLESKRRWARKKRLQEKQAAQAGKSGSNTPNLEDTDDEGDDGDDGADGADADISGMSMSFAHGGSGDGGDDTFSMPTPAEAHRRASLKAESIAHWETSHQMFASQGPAKRQALAPSTASNVADPSTTPSQYPTALPLMSGGAFVAQELAAASGGMYSSSPMRHLGLSIALPQPHQQQQGMGPTMLSNPNESFSSNSSEYSQPGSASFFKDSFGGNMSNSGSETANTSIDTPATTWPALPPIDGDKVAAAMQGQPRVQQRGDKDAAIQLLALRSGSNSPADDRKMSLKRRESDGDATWSSTPSRGKAASEHAALIALSSSTAAEITGRKNDEVIGGLSPSPVSRTLASGAGSRSAVRVMPISTPGPSSRSGENPFSLDKHKISPYEGRRKLSYSGAPASPIASPTHLTFVNSGIGGGFSMGKSVSSTSTSTGPLGVKLPPLVSTPIRPSSQIEGTEMGMERIKMDSLPPLLGSASKKLGGGAGVSAPMMSTPFSKPMMSNLGYSAMRRGDSNSTSAMHHDGSMANSVRPSPSRHHSNDQFSSPQHLNLTESLGLAPHSISRTSSYTSACYASSLGLTPSVAGMSGGLIVGGSGTPFHSGLGALSGLGGFTPLSTAKVGGSGVVFWPDSTRKSAMKGSPTVYKSHSQAEGSMRKSAKRKFSTLSRAAGACSKSRTASPVLAAGKGDIFDADYRKNVSAAGGPSSDDTFSDDDDVENLMSIGALDTPSRPAAMRKLPRTSSSGSHKLAPAPTTPGRNAERAIAAQRSPLGSIKINY
ncbi:uncharacterized protein UBRO_01127 [Ustilago bromivora]|uniref:Uncharacterized protein n=1 Tax=Ustilago bromivora TaxID=307758 RepID=A0A1K0H470_9BASI|nr:uncharacterized protein UBRO_01127 [Ustilago bromivora]SYW77775.1 uncharacterized protein UBRO2_01967 [Ustilago bromivora]